MTEENKIRKVFNHPDTRAEDASWDEMSKEERVKKLKETFEEVELKHAESTAQGLYIHRKVIEYNRPKPKT